MIKKFEDELVKYIDDDRIDMYIDLNPDSKIDFYGVPFKTLKRIGQFYKIKNDNIICDALVKSPHFETIVMGLMFANSKIDEIMLRQWIQYTVNLNEVITKTYLVAFVAETRQVRHYLAYYYENKQTDLENVFYYSLFMNYMSITKLPDEELIKRELENIRQNYESSNDTVRYSMINFMITCAIQNPKYIDEIKRMYKDIQHIKINDIKYKIPNVLDYIKKAENNNKIGVKKNKIREI